MSLTLPHDAGTASWCWTLPRDAGRCLMMLGIASWHWELPHDAGHCLMMLDITPCRWHCLVMLYIASWCRHCPMVLGTASWYWHFLMTHFMDDKAIIWLQSHLLPKADYHVLYKDMFHSFNHFSTDTRYFSLDWRNRGKPRSRKYSWIQFLCPIKIT
jgi:hypothetical protein